MAKALHERAAGGLLRPFEAIYMARRKPREQLFDTEADPHEINDLAQDPAFRDKLEELRAVHRAWVLEHRDLGFLPESEMWLQYDGAAAKAFSDDPSLYPIERILETADWVGLGDRLASRQERRLGDPDATVRFWAAVGLLANGTLSSSASGALAQTLDDPSQAVATISAQALCAGGDCDRPLRVLLEQLRHSDERVALRAANSLHQLGSLADPVRGQLQSFHRPVSGFEGRDFFGKAPFRQYVLRALLSERR